MFANKNDVDAVRPQSLQIFGSRDSRFADENPRIFHQVCHTHRVIQVRFHRPQISIVDSEERIARVRKPEMIQYSAKIFCVVHFQQNGHSQFDAENLKVDDLAFAQTFGDQQDCIRASGSRFPDLICIDNEILAQHRKGYRISNGVYVFQFSAEICRIGQARDRSGTTRVILSCDGDRIEIFADDSRRWTFVLDFSNQSSARCVPVVENSLEKIPRPAKFGDSLAEFL